MVEQIGNKAIYGSVVLRRETCPDCNAPALVLDGRFACCGRPVGNRSPELCRYKRMVAGERRRRPLPKRLKKEILDRQDGKCIYCGRAFGEPYWDKKSNKVRATRANFDHFFPWASGRQSPPENYVAACGACNRTKSDFVFETIEAARKFVLKKRRITCSDEKTTSGASASSARLSLSSEPTTTDSVRPSAETSGTMTAGQQPTKPAELS
jgi:5-methylcytosine-specific restriction endonuclease McrA